MNIIENERQSCAKSFAYFCEHYLKLNEFTGKGKVPFRLFGYQSRLIQQLEKNRFVIGKKFRQGGFTSLMTAWYLWRCMFQPEEANMIITHRDRMAIWASEIARAFLKELPDWLQPETSKQNDHQIIFANGSKLFFYTPTPEACCGRSLNNIYIDEAAFLEGADKHWKAIFPTIATSGRACVLSSPNGTEGDGKWFYEMLTNASVGESEFKVYKCDISEHPIYADREWQKEIYQNLGDKGYRQEVLAEFLIPGASVLKVEFEPEEDPSWHPVGSIEEEVAKMQELDPSWKPDVQPHEYKNDKRVERVFLCGDDINDPFDSWTDKPTPTVHEWEKLKPETIHVIFEEAHKHWDESETKHPELDATKEFDSVEDLSEFWDGMAEIEPELGIVADMYRKAARDKSARYQELEDALYEYCDPDMLALGGVLDTKEAKVLREEMGEDAEVIKSGRLDIIESILSEGDFPDNMNLGIHKDYLSINGVPTNIMTDAIKWAYMGLTGLTSHEEAVEHIASILKAKIKNLF